jgi:hypothetical protein
MSRSKNNGKRTTDKHRPVSLSLKTNECDDSKALRKMLHVVVKRRSWGTTEKIIRRHKKMWSRALGKARRRADVVVIETELNEGT